MRFLLALVVVLGAVICASAQMGGGQDMTSQRPGMGGSEPARPTRPAGEDKDKDDDDDDEEMMECDEDEEEDSSEEDKSMSKDKDSSEEDKSMSKDSSEEMDDKKDKMMSKAKEAMKKKMMKVMKQMKKMKKMQKMKPVIKKVMKNVMMRKQQASNMRQQQTRGRKMMPKRGGRGGKVMPKKRGGRGGRGRGKRAADPMMKKKKCKPMCNVCRINVNGGDINIGKERGQCPEKQACQEVKKMEESVFGVKMTIAMSCCKPADVTTDDKTMNN